MKLQEFLKGGTAQELVKEAKSCKNADELMKFAGEHDVEVTKEEADRFFAKKVELTNEELDQVSGGRSYLNHNSDPVCPDCGGLLVLQDPSGEWHHGCDGQAYNLYKCQNCGSKFDWFWEDAGWCRD